MSLEETSTSKPMPKNIRIRVDGARPSAVKNDEQKKKPRTRLKKKKEKARRLRPETDLMTQT